MASVRGPNDIRQLLQVPALASIPIIVHRARQGQASTLDTLYPGPAAPRWSFWRVVMVHFFVRPLDVIWLILMRKFGV